MKEEVSPQAGMNVLTFGFLTIWRQDWSLECFGDHLVWVPTKVRNMDLGASTLFGRWSQEIPAGNVTTENNGAQFQ